MSSLEECCFYHTMDLPGVGMVTGDWDLRGGVSDHLGNVALAGKRVLEIGPANGFLSFEMERSGAEVVGYDLSHQAGRWEAVPLRGRPTPQW